MTWGNLSGGARTIRITGQPEIPDQLQLASRNDLVGWNGSYYTTRWGTTISAAWTKTDGEIVGKKFETGRAGCAKVCCATIVHLLEDSVVDYDFYYEPEQTHVHPVLGRAAFLLDPEGVRSIG